jgi:hypothetical protein
MLFACTLPADEGVTPIDPDDLPPELANTTTTSTTTTTTTTTTLPVDTSEPVETDPTTSTSSTLSIATAPVELYYVDRAADGLQPINRQLPQPISLDSVISQLQQPPPDLASFGVETSLTEDLIAAGHTLDRSVLTISLNSAVFDQMSEDDKREAIAQMVLTFTSFSVPAAGNIGSVVLQVDGVPIPVFKPADGTTSEPGAPLYFDDFSTLIVGTANNPPSTAVTAPPTQSTAPTPTGP